MDNQLNFNSNVDLDLTLLIINLTIGVIISLLISFHYRKFGSTLTNRDDFSNVFPFITLTTILVISVVKSSLALSLGLVGALSIVRFRTPIKEPEELAYLFICIAAGLGYGANQTVATTVTVILILVFISIIKFRKIKITEKNIYLTIESNDKSDIKSSDFSKSINKILEDQNGNYDLKRLDITEDIFQATYILNLKDVDTLNNIVKVLQSKYPTIKINFIDQNQVPSI
tara:strand:- start:740 stop:1426 length:687 start_codon:yes stop_codon:yes gene_type:complete